MSEPTFSIKRMVDGAYNADGTQVEVTLETQEGPTLTLRARYFMLGALIHGFQAVATEARKVRVSKGDLSALETAVDLDAAGELTRAVEVLNDPNSTDVILRVTRKSGALEHIRLTRELAEVLFSSMKTVGLQDRGNSPGALSS